MYTPPPGQSGESFASMTIVLDDLILNNAAKTVVYYNINILPTPSASLQNTIIAGNNAVNDPDASGQFTASANNFLGSSAGNSGIASTVGNPTLDPLANNGGPTETMLPSINSPVLGQGNPSLAPPTDQRGFARVIGGLMDIGAVEFQGMSLAATAGTPQTAQIDQAFAVPLQVTASENVSDAPLPGVEVDYTPPTSGAGATFSSIYANTGANGQASVTATANGITGSYSVNAFAPGPMGNVSATAFYLTNILDTQSITFAALSPVTYGVAPFALSASATSGQPVAFSILNGPCALSGSTLTVKGAGSCSIQANQSGGGNYSPAQPVTQTLSINQAPLTVTANAATRSYGAANPFFTATVSGFVNNDNGGTDANLTITSGVNIPSGPITGTPSITSIANATTAPGAAPIVPAAGTLTSANYSFAFVSGTLTITQASQTITFNSIPPQSVGGAVTLTASASSGLAVAFTSLTGAVCSVSGNVASLKAAGTCTIQGAQAGNADYGPAPSVDQSFNVTAGFTITATPPSETATDDFAAVVLEIQSAGGFKGNVKLSCSGGPAGSACSDLPQSVYVNGEAFALSGVRFARSTPRGQYAITFTGVSGTATNSTSATITVR